MCYYTSMTILDTLPAPRPRSTAAPAALVNAADGLTAAEQRLLSVLLNPEYIGRPVTERCQAAEISRESYYQIIRRPRFQAARATFVQALLGDGVLDVLATVRRKAVNGDMVAARLYLQCAGMLEERHRLEVARVPDPAHRAVAAMSAEKFAEFQELGRRLLYGDDDAVDVAGSVTGPIAALPATAGVASDG